MADSAKSHGARNIVIIALLIPCLFFAIILGIVLIFDVTRPVCNPSGAAVAVDPKTVPAGPIAGYNHEQLVNAAQIMVAAQKLGLTVRDQQIGVMTAMGESHLTVLDHGDAVGPDSRGLFQQRANGAWGSLSDRMNPFISATNFFKVEMKVAGREAMEPTLVAHRVQGNADPYHYASYWSSAQTVVQALAGVKAANPSDTSSGGQTNPGNAHYATAGMKPQTTVVANTLGQMFHLKTVGGYRPMSSPYDDPVYGHSSGLAIDFMIDDIPNGATTGSALARYITQHAATLGVQYVIWQQHIWSPQRADEGWRPMPDRGSPTQNHMDHVHLSLNGTGGGKLPPGGAGCPATSTRGTASTSGPTGTPSQSQTDTQSAKLDSDTPTHLLPDRKLTQQDGQMAEERVQIAFRASREDRRKLLHRAHAEGVTMQVFFERHMLGYPDAQDRPNSQTPVPKKPKHPQLPIETT